MRSSWTLNSTKFPHVHSSPHPSLSLVCPVRRPHLAFVPHEASRLLAPRIFGTLAERELTAAVDLEKAIGFTSEPQDVAWNQRDVLLYAVGIGAKRSELQWAYELSPAWHPFPTYALVLPFKGASSTVVNFADSKEASGNVHLPAINPNNFVHASQSIQILRPIPASSEGQEGWKIYKRLVSLKDTGKGLIIGVESSLVGPNGQEYVRMAVSLHLRSQYSQQLLTSAGLLVRVRRLQGRRIQQEHRREASRSGARQGPRPLARFRRRGPDDGGAGHRLPALGRLQRTAR